MCSTDTPVHSTGSSTMENAYESVRERSSRRGGQALIRESGGPAGATVLATQPIPSPEQIHETRGSARSSALAWPASLR